MFRDQKLKAQWNNVKFNVSNFVRVTDIALFLYEPRQSNFSESKQVLYRCYGNFNYKNSKSSILPKGSKI